MILNPMPIDITGSDFSTISWSCKLCKVSYGEEDLIRQHVVLEHLQDYYKDLVPDGEKIYTCSQCHDHSSNDRKVHILHLATAHQVDLGLAFITMAIQIFTSTYQKGVRREKFYFVRTC